MSVRSAAVGFVRAATLLALVNWVPLSTARAQEPAGPEKKEAQPQPVAGAPTASDILQKTLTAYQTAKSYQGDWLYLLKEGDAVTRMVVELRSKGPTRLVFHLKAAPSATATKAQPDVKQPAVPELRVVLDGKLAWFENATEKVYYRVSLPKSTVGTPLMFFPQMSTVGPAERGEDQKENGRTIAVIFAQTKTGGLSRMEIDVATSHIVRIASDEAAGFSRTISTLTIDKEVFDGEIADSVFTYKPPKGFKEMPPPPEALMVFGTAAPDKTDKGK